MKSDTAVSNRTRETTGCCDRELLNKGLQLLEQGSACEALNVFDVVCKDQTYLAGVNYIRARALLELGRLDEAREACQAELQRQANHKGAQELLTRIEMQHSAGVSKELSGSLCSAKIGLFDEEPTEVLKAKELVKSYYHKRMKDVWYNAKPPVWFDHEIDYHLWPRNLFWIERGIYGRMVMCPGCRVLDLCCGDGYYSDVWYSSIAGSIDACDNDKDALRFASQRHSNPKVSYYKVDILTDAFPRPRYDVITWFEAIEHFSEVQIVGLLEKMAGALEPHGAVIGSTPIVQERTGTRNPQHDREFASPEDLRAVLRKVFVDPEIWVSIYQQRITCYFKLTK